MRIFPIGNMKIESIEDFGKILKERRKQIGITQKKLALGCGTGLRFISDLENGKATCHIGKVLRVVQALGMDLDVSSKNGRTNDGRVGDE